MYIRNNLIQETNLSCQFPQTLGNAMNCDICGRVIGGQAFKVEVEGAKMLVCHNCQKLGKPYKEEPRPISQPQRQVIRGTTYLQPPSRKRTAELPKEMGQFDLADDIAERVKKYRAKLGLSQDQLAKRVKEKLSVIQKIETGKMSPDMRLCRELEHELKVKLLVPHTETEDLPTGSAPTEVTLGDIIRIKDKTKTTEQQN
jgi:putative transcription factor